MKKNFFKYLLYIKSLEVYGHPTTQWNNIENRAPPPPTINNARGDSKAHGYLSEDLMAYLVEEINHSKFDETDKEMIQNMFINNRIDVLEKTQPANIKQARGDSESHGYLAAFSLKILLAMAASADWEICKIFVSEAFLTTKVNKKYPQHISKHKHVDMSYYTRRPPGFTDEDMPYIMKPKCYIYGHPLAMAFFNMDAKHMFIDGLEFSTSNYDRRVYYKRDERSTVIVAHAVDDFTIFASSPELKCWIIREITKYYPDITIQHELETVLGIKVSRDRNNKTIPLKQEGSIHNCLNAHFPDWKNFSLDDLPKSVLSPIPPHVSKEDTLLNDNILPEKDKTLYQKKIGELVWITHTLPE